MSSSVKPPIDEYQCRKPYIQLVLEIGEPKPGDQSYFAISSKIEKTYITEEMIKETVETDVELMSNPDFESGPFIKYIFEKGRKLFGLTMLSGVHSMVFLQKLMEVVIDETIPSLELFDFSRFKFPKGSSYSEARFRVDYDRFKDTQRFLSYTKLSSWNVNAIH